MFPTMKDLNFSVTVDVRGKEGEDRSFTVNTAPPVDSGVFFDSMFAQQVLGRDAKVGIYGVSVIAGRVLFTPAYGVDEEERKRLKEALGGQAEQYFDALSAAATKFPDSDLIGQVAEVVFNFAIDKTITLAGLDSERKLPDVKEIEVGCGDYLPMGQVVSTREDRLSFYSSSPVEVYRENGTIHVGCVGRAHRFYTFITQELVRRVKESLERDTAKFVVNRLARRAVDRHLDELADDAIRIKYGVDSSAVQEEVRKIEKLEVEVFAAECRRMAGMETGQPLAGRHVFSEEEHDSLQAALDERSDDWEKRSGGIG